MGNLHENVTESDLAELFGQSATNYLIVNCSIEMFKSQQNGNDNGHGFILARYDVCNKFVNYMAWNFTAAKLLLKKLKHHQGLY